MRGQQHQNHRGCEQHDDDEGQQLLGVDLPGALVVLGGADQQRDQNAGEDPAEQELVDDVGGGVGDVVGRADPGDTQDRGDGGVADEAGAAGGDRAHRHRAGGAA